MFELSPETYARLRQARASLADEHGRYLDDDTFIASLCEIALARTSQPDTTGRARHQVAVTVCEKCDQAWQAGGGVQVPIDAVALDPRPARHHRGIYCRAASRATTNPRGTTPRPTLTLNGRFGTSNHALPPEPLERSCEQTLQGSVRRRRRGARFVGARIARADWAQIYKLRAATAAAA